MSLPRDLKDYLVYVDGEQKGECVSGQAPKLAYKVDEWIGGGMAGPISIDQHLEKMSCEWSARGIELASYQQFGKRKLGAVGLRFVGAYQQPDTGAVDSVEHIMRGNHSEVDSGDMKRGEPGTTKIMSTLTSYELRVNDVEIVHIDLIAGVERYGGKDIRSAIRSALS
jgi:uncharacterized protein